MNAEVDPLVAELVQARKQQHITQEGLAGLAGVSRRTIAGMESGGDITLSTLRKLCAALGVEIHVEGQGSAPRRRPILDDVIEEQRQERFGRRERG